MKKQFIFLFLLSFAIAACSSGEHAAMDMQVDTEEEFLTMMVPHHQEAIDSSQVLIQRTKNEDLKIFAENVVAAQSAEIEQMQTWGKIWFDKTISTSNKHYEEMMPNLSSLSGEELDQAYIKGMIEHHEMAVEMAGPFADNMASPDLQDFADKIEDNQSDEIVFLKSWEKNLYEDETLGFSFYYPAVFIREDNTLWTSTIFELKEKGATDQMPFITVKTNELEGKTLEEFVIAEHQMGEEDHLLEIDALKGKEATWKFTYTMIGEREFLKLYLPEKFPVTEYYTVEGDNVLTFQLVFTPADLSPIEKMLASLKFQ